MQKRLDICSDSFKVSWGQLDRHLTILERNLESINIALQGEKEDQNLHELSEIRKVYDHSIETDFENIKQSNQEEILERGTQYYPFVGWILLYISLSDSIGTYINFMSRDNNNSSMSWCIIIISVLISLGMPLLAIYFIMRSNTFLSKRMKWISRQRDKKSDKTHKSEKFDGAQYSKFMFELLFTDTEIQLHEDKVEDIINEWSQEMIAPDSKSKDTEKSEDKGSSQDNEVDTTVPCEFFKKSIEDRDINARRKYFLKSKSTKDSDYYYIGLEVNKFEKKVFLSSFKIVYLKTMNKKIDSNRIIKTLAKQYLHKLFKKAGANIDPDRIIKDRGLE